VVAPGQNAERGDQNEADGDDRGRSHAIRGRDQRHRHETLGKISTELYVRDSANASVVDVGVIDGSAMESGL